jgi:hypothetical protein
VAPIDRECGGQREELAAQEKVGRLVPPLLVTGRERKPSNAGRKHSCRARCISAGDGRYFSLFLAHVQRHFFAGLLSARRVSSSTMRTTAAACFVVHELAASPMYPPSSLLGGEDHRQIS